MRTLSVAWSEISAVRISLDANVLERRADQSLEDERSGPVQCGVPPVESASCREHVAQGDFDQGLSAQEMTEK